jgi:RHS repeat-associated protein
VTLDYTPGTNQLSATSQAGDTTSYTYLPSGLLHTRAPAGGNGGLTFDYLPASALTATADVTGGDSLSFGYDANGYRRVKRVGSTGPSLYVHAGGPGPMVTVDASGTPTAWIYGVNGLVAMARGGHRYSVVTDYLGSPRLVLDDAGALTAAYSFDALGRSVLAHEPQPGFLPYLFTGQELDSELGLYAFPARLYDPALGRFLAPDATGQYASPYVYVGNQPSMLVDPTGQLSTLAEAGIELGLALLLVAAIAVTGGAAATLVPAAMAAEGTAAAMLAGAGIGAAGGAVMGAAGRGLMYSLETPPGQWDPKDFGESVWIGAVAGAVGGAISGGIAGGFVSPAAGAAADLGEDVASQAPAATEDTPLIRPSAPSGGSDDIDEVAPGRGGQDGSNAQVQGPGSSQESLPAPAQPASRAAQAWANMRPQLLPNAVAGIVGGAAQGATKAALTNVVDHTPFELEQFLFAVAQYAAFGAATSMLGAAFGGADQAYGWSTSLKTAYQLDAYVLAPAIGLTLMASGLAYGGFVAYTSLTQPASR